MYTLVLKSLIRFVSACGRAVVLHPRLRARLFAPTGHSGHDAYLFARFERCLDALREAHILAVDVYVDEAAQLAGLVEQAVLQPGVLSVQIIYTLCERLAVA